MFSTFRLSMTWLHTWFGLVLGHVLIVVFFFGALSVFDREIDRWAIPQTRFTPQPMPSFDSVLAPIFQRMGPSADELDAARQRLDGVKGATLPAHFVPMNWAAYTTHRDPVLALYTEYALPNPDDPDDHVNGEATVDPRNGQLLPGNPLKVGSEFFYPMHYALNLTWKELGSWIVGLAGLVMLAALVSGVVIHRRIFREFFTFRPRKHLQRSTLDLHNLTGVVALPFHFMFALTGLTIFAGVYFPVSETLLKPQAQLAAVAEVQARKLAFKPAGVPAPLASVDAMVVEARRRWAARGMPGEVGYLFVNHVGDRNSYVSVFRAGDDRVTRVGQPIHFEGTTGRVLLEEAPPSAVASVNDFLTGLHLQHFRHWLLRWFYVFGGLSGCICIATGFVFFVEKRKRQHAKAGAGGARWADATAVATVMGMLLATLAMLVATRGLPADITQRSDWQKAAFWGAWVLAFGHALWRSAPVRSARLSPAWFEQCCAVAVLAFSAVLLNGIGTGDHLLKTLGEGYWPVAGVDLALLATGALAAVAARMLHRRAKAGVAGAPMAAVADNMAEAANA